MAENIFDSRDPSETARILASLPMPVSSWIRKQVFDVVRQHYTNGSDIE